MNKELIIFGADGNLGREITDVLLKKDYNNFHLIGRKKNNTSGNSYFIQADDLTKEENIKKVFSKITPSKDKLFFLFSTIGGYTGGKNLWEIEQNDLEHMFRLNVEISFLIAKHFSLLVKESAGGSICFTSALTSLSADIKKSAYGASKSALNYLVQTLAAEGKSVNLSVNAIAPFILDTAENREWVKDSTLLIRLEEIGELIHNIFNSFRILSGNIIRLPHNLEV
jgi:NAD(P)-dependent dehydrogenase (short-subunit alcohol dehydrogenase family)